MLDWKWGQLMLFIPEGNKSDRDIPVDLHDKWVVRLLTLCTDLFGGATSYGRGVGSWKSSGKIYWDRITVVETWIPPDDPKLIERKLKKILKGLLNMRRQLNQKTVGYIINNRFAEVSEK